MLTEKSCGCEDNPNCGGKYTDTEFAMNELDPSRSVQEYHEIMDLLERAYDIAEDRALESHRRAGKGTRRDGEAIRQDEGWEQVKVESVPDPSDPDERHVRVTMEDEGWIALLEWESYATMEELRRKLQKAGVNL